MTTSEHAMKSIDQDDDFRVVPRSCPVAESKRLRALSNDLLERCFDLLGPAASLPVNWSGEDKP